MLIEKIDTIAHKLIIIRLITRSTTKFRNTSSFGECNPNLRNENSFKVKTYYIHFSTLS